MASLQEILAAKKAAALADKPTAPVEQKPADTKEEKPVTTITMEKTVAEPVKEEEPAVAAPKPLTFAEKMALKKRQEEEQQKVKTSQEAPVQVASSLDVGLAATPVSEDTKTPSTQLKPQTQQEKIEVAEDKVSPQTEQAYADIKERIDLLSAMSDTDLPNAMSNLKKALMQNPAAVSLMEDMDIGKMVVALRRVTGEALAEAAKEKKPGRKAKEVQVDLTNPDVVAAVFDEL